VTRRAHYYPLRAYDDDFMYWLERVGFGPAEVTVLSYETDADGVRWANIEQPHVENSIVGILAKKHGKPLPPPPERKRVLARLVVEIK
jgi:hypothetical protein